MWTLIIVAFLNGQIAMQHVEFIEQPLCFEAKAMLEKNNLKLGPTLQVYCIKTIE